MVFIVEVRALNDEPAPSGASTDTGPDWPGLGTLRALRLKLSVHWAHAPEAAKTPASSATLAGIARLRAANRRVTKLISCLRHHGHTHAGRNYNETSNTLHSDAEPGTHASAPRNRVQPSR